MHLLHAIYIPKVYIETPGKIDFLVKKKYNIFRLHNRTAERSIMSIWCMDDWDISPSDIAPREVAVYEQVIASLEPVLAVYQQYLEEEKRQTVEYFEAFAKTDKKTAEIFAQRDEWSAEEVAEIDEWTEAAGRIAEWNLRILDVEQEITKYKIKLVWSKLCSISFQCASLGYYDYEPRFTSGDIKAKMQEFKERQKHRKKLYDDYSKELTDLQNQLEQLISQYVEYDDCLLSESDKQWFSTY